MGATICIKIISSTFILIQQHRSSYGKGPSSSSDQPRHRHTHFIRMSLLIVARVKPASITWSSCTTTRPELSKKWPSSLLPPISCPFKPIWVLTTPNTNNIMTNPQSCRNIINTHRSSQSITAPTAPPITISMECR